MVTSDIDFMTLDSRFVAKAISTAVSLCDCKCKWQLFNSG